MSVLAGRRRAIFLDRDGVLNVNRVDHVKEWSEFQFEAGALDALRRLAATGFAIVVVSNQAGIARGVISAETVGAIHAALLNEVEKAGGRIDRIYYCPHAPADRCDCRKPRPGMLQQAEAELGVNLARSFLIGDWIDDLRAGAQVGCTTLLVGTGRGPQAALELASSPELNPVCVKNLSAAVDWILADAESGGGKPPGVAMMGEAGTPAHVDNESAGDRRRA